METLPVIDLSDQACIGGNVGLRPFREGGPRLEAESLGKKIIYHNYGHGGSGVSLAPGSVWYTVNSFLRHCYGLYSGPVAVLGSGYMGLLTAESLSRRGIAVVLYADSFPQRGFVFKPGTSCITSQVAGGYWMPFGVDITDQKLHRDMQEESWRYYTQCIRRQIYSGICFRDAYCFGEYNPFAQSFLPIRIRDEMKPHRIKFKFEGSATVIEVLKFRTISINGELFLSDVLDALRKRSNVKVIQRKFDSLEVVTALTEGIVFNCLGLGAGKVFKDDKMVSIKGQLLYLKPQPGINSFIFGQGNYGRFSVYPLGNKLAVGLTYEKGKGDLILEEDVLAKYKTVLEKFYQEYGVFVS